VRYQSPDATMPFTDPLVHLFREPELTRMMLVDIIFKTDKIEQLFHDGVALKKKWGQEMARCIRRRLDDLRAAPTLRDVRAIPGALTGDAEKLGRLHLAVQPPHGIILEPVDDLAATRGKVDWTQVTIVRVLGIGTADD
jgi:proteic killer suppression protein